MGFWGCYDEFVATKTQIFETVLILKTYINCEFIRKVKPNFQT